MTTPRDGHTATLLPGGKVLIAGGEVVSTIWIPLASAELYDPSTGAFSPAGNMTTARVGHTATLLTDGRVLIAGGFNFTNEIAGGSTSAELYDPSTGTFTATGSMLTVMYSSIATLLYDGRVLVMGPYVGTPGELYDPATGTFTVTGPFAGAYATPVVNTATLLPDGTVLITGYDGGVFPSCGVGPLVELFDPGTGTFSLTAGGPGPMADLWANSNTATLLRNGKVLIVSSGYDDGDPVLPQGVLYEPSTQIFSAIGNTTAPHADSTATLLPDGEVLIAGGAVGLTGRDNGSVGTDLYDPATGTFSAAGNMILGRYSHTATLLPNGTVLIAGGDTRAFFRPPAPNFTSRAC